MKRKQVNIEYFELDDKTGLDEKEQRLINKARSAAKRAYAPYSEFRVGAAVLLENGEIFTGSNQENAAYPSGLCAERTALFAAASQFPDVPVKLLVVTATSRGETVINPVPPCGACRQVILETQNRYHSPIKLIMYGEEKTYIIENAASMLPIPFEKF